MIIDRKYYVRKEMIAETKPNPTMVKKGDEYHYNILVFDVEGKLPVKLKDTINKEPLLKFDWYYKIEHGTGHVREKEGLKEHVLQLLNDKESI